MLVPGAPPSNRLPQVLKEGGAWIAIERRAAARWPHPFSTRSDSNQWAQIGAAAMAGNRGITPRRAKHKLLHQAGQTFLVKLGTRSPSWAHPRGVAFRRGSCGWVPWRWVPAR